MKMENTKKRHLKMVILKYIYIVDPVYGFNNKSFQ